MSAFKYFTKMHLCTKGYCPDSTSATRSENNFVTEVKARVATSGLCFYRPSTAGRSDRRYKYDSESLQVEPVMHGMNGTQQRQKFSS